MKKIFYITIILFCATSFAISVYVLCNDRKSAYVDTFKLYGSYKLKQQLEASLENFKNTQQKQMDSVALVIKSNEATGNIGTDELERLKNFYAYKAQNIESDIQKLSEQYNTQIWNQLNQYISDYGKTKGLDIIHGGRGDGGVMYVREDMDITADVIKYVNEKFNVGTIK